MTREVTFGGTALVAVLGEEQSIWEGREAWGSSQGRWPQAVCLERVGKPISLQLAPFPSPGFPGGPRRRPVQGHPGTSSPGVAYTAHQHEPWPSPQKTPSSFQVKVVSSCPGCCAPASRPCSGRAEGIAGHTCSPGHSCSPGHCGSLPTWSFPALTSAGLDHMLQSRGHAAQVIQKKTRAHVLTKLPSQPAVHTTSRSGHRQLSVNWFGQRWSGPSR